MVDRGTRIRRSNHRGHRSRLLFPHAVFRKAWSRPGLGCLPGGFLHSLAHGCPAHLCGFRQGRECRKRCRAQWRPGMAPTDGRGHRLGEIGVSLRRSGLCRQIHPCRDPVAEAAPGGTPETAFLALRRMGARRGQISDRRGLPTALERQLPARKPNPGSARRLLHCTLAAGRRPERTAQCNSSTAPAGSNRWICRRRRLDLGRKLAATAGISSPPKGRWL